MNSILETLPVQTTAGNYFISNYPPFSCWNSEELPQFIHALTSAPKKKPLGLYVHLPFCRHRCHYCYFRVYPRRSPEDVHLYIHAVLEELERYERYPALENRAPTSVYFGGGSPSFLSCEELTFLFHGLQKRISWEAVQECTFECEPGTVSLEKLQLLRSLGVTRLSLGFQTLDDNILRHSGRDVRIKDCMAAFCNAREAGFNEINIDLLAGLPGETESTWRATMNRVLELLPDCITIYQLELTHNSTFFKSIKAGREVPLANWPEKQNLTAIGFEMCENAGYTIGSGYMAIRHPAKWRFIYTVENFWHGGDLLALGESAFGHLQGTHYQNLDRFDTYTRAIKEGHLPIRRTHKLTGEEKIRREVILQLKTGSLDRPYFREKFGIELLDHFENEFDFLLRENLATVEGEQIKLTRNALIRVDWLLPHFYLPEHKGIRYS